MRSLLNCRSILVLLLLVVSNAQTQEQLEMTPPSSLRATATATATATTATTPMNHNNVTKMCAVLNINTKDPLHCKKGKHKKNSMRINCSSGPGSPCKVDPDDGNSDNNLNQKIPISISDIYCNDDGLHETVWRGSQDCSDDDGTGRQQKINVFYPKDQCVGGHIFVSCDPGPCPHNNDDEDEQHEDEEIADALWWNSNQEEFFVPSWAVQE